MEKRIRKYERFRYSDDSVQNALEEIRRKSLSLSAASRKYGIPKGTLFNKLKGKVPLIRKMGPETVLTIAEEAQLEKWIIEKALLGFPMHPDEVKDSVQRVLKGINRQNPFVDDRPGRKWLKLFLNRHKNVTQRNAEIISKARASVSEEGIRSWFQELEQYLQNENCADILIDPMRIFNADETGLQTCPKSGKLLGPKNYRNFYEIASGPEKECVTVLCTFSAAGASVPPMVVYPYKRIPRDIAANFPDDWGIGRSDSGWMTSATFYEFIGNIFLPWLQKHQIKLPILLLLDGHKSHIGMDLYNLCTQNGIILYCLLPNATHILQPCDVSVFKSIKVHWKKIVLQHKQKTTKSVNKNVFATLFKEAYENAIQPNTIKHGFRKCGIFPFTADAVDYSQCISKRREEQKKKSCKDSIIDTSEYQTALKVMEHHLDLNLLLTFKNSTIRNETTDSPLFKIWKLIKEGSGEQHAIENVHDEDKIISNTIEENTYSDIEMIDLSNDVFSPEEFMRLPIEIDGIVYESTDDLNNDQIFLNEKSYLDKVEEKQQNIELIGKEVINEEESHNVCIGILTAIINAVIDKVEKKNLESYPKIIVHSNINVKDVWLEHLHWPKIDQKGIKRKSTRAMPFAITSMKWKKYVEDIEARKKEEEDLKIQKKHDREQKNREKANKREKPKKVKKGKLKAAEAETAMEGYKMSVMSEPEERMQSTRKGKQKLPETVTSLPENGLPKEFEEHPITVGSYVIAKYKQRYYPGIVLSIEDTEYELRAMTPVGTNYFKWPNPPDQIWYKKTDIKEAIEAPKLIKRDCYECPEMCKYNSKL